MKFCTTFESYALLYLLLKYSLLLLVCIPLTWRTRGVRNTFLLFFSWKISTRAQFSKKKFQATECDLHNFSSSFGFDEERKTQILHTFLPPNRPWFYPDLALIVKELTKRALHFVFKRSVATCVGRIAFESFVYSLVFYQCNVKELGWNGNKRKNKLIRRCLQCFPVVWFQIHAARLDL